jgi:hypothetical protein
MTARDQAHSRMLTSLGAMWANELTGVFKKAIMAVPSFLYDK